MPPSKYQKILKENAKLLENRNWDRAPLILAENKKHIESVQNSILFLHFLLNNQNCQIQLPPRFVKQISKWADITGGSKRLHNSHRRRRCEEEWRRVNWKNNIRERKHTINERMFRLCGSRNLSITNAKCLPLFEFECWPSPIKSQRQRTDLCFKYRGKFWHSTAQTHRPNM